MTKESCLSKIEELKKIAFVQLDKRINEILCSGFLDLENQEDNYLIPKTILCASMQYAALQLITLSNYGRETF